MTPHLCVYAARNLQQEGVTVVRKDPVISTTASFHEQLSFVISVHFSTEVAKHQE